MTVNQHLSHCAPQALRFRKTALALALGQVLALSAPVALAATINVSGGCTLENAITAANSDTSVGSCASGAGADTIVLSSNITLSAPLPVVTSTVTLEGNNATVSGNNNYRVFEVDNGGSLELQNTTISDGSANFGGGIFVNNSTLTLTNSTVSGNYAHYDGGGIYARYSTVTLVGSIVSGNSAHFYGGGIVVSSRTANSINSTLTLTNSTVSGNSSRYDGGGILAYRSVVHLIDDSKILNNNLSGPDGGVYASHGGGIYALHSTVTLANSTISNNIVSGPSGSFGGGIYARSSTVTLTDSTISTNTVNTTTVKILYFGQGGGISAISSGITLTNSTVSGNIADANGGGVYVGDGSLTLTNSTVSGNSANKYGGGIAAGYNNTLTMTNSTVSGNSVNKYGGGISARHNTVTLTNSTVSGNFANSKGGGVIAYNSTVDLTNSTVSGNSAPSKGGGIYAVYGATAYATLKLTSSTITGNSAGSGGGVLFGEITIRNDGDIVKKKRRIGNRSNSATFRAVNNSNSSSFTLQNTIIANSTGGDCVNDSVITPTNTNSLIEDGGTNCGTSLPNVDPNLGTLANNGGLTQTHALKKGSPAIDQISSTGGCGAGVTTDQRGFTRPQGATSLCDIGAFELRAPTAVDDSYTVAAGQSLTAPATGILSNDTNPENSSDNPLTAVKVSDPSHGSVTLNADGSFTYTPTSGYVGNDSFTYKANNGTDSNTATVNITVTAVNHAPTANNDSYSASRNQSLTVTAATGVLANDTDPDGNTLTVIKVSDPAHGTVTLNSDGSFTYTPTSGYVGTDSFTYKANDGKVDSNTATVTITINSGVPTANPDSYSTGVNQKLTVPAPGVLSNDDANGNTKLIVTQASGPSHGTLSLQSDGGFVYTPNTGFVGQDTFTYQVNGSTAATDQVLSKAKASGVAAADGISNTATVTITISAEIPTLSEWAQIAAAALLTLLGWLGLRRRTPE